MTSGRQDFAQLTQEEALFEEASEDTRPVQVPLTLLLPNGNTETIQMCSNSPMSLFKEKAIAAYGNKCPDYRTKFGLLDEQDSKPAASLKRTNQDEKECPDEENEARAAAFLKDKDSNVAASSHRKRGRVKLEAQDAKIQKLRAALQEAEAEKEQMLAQASKKPKQE